MADALKKIQKYSQLLTTREEIDAAWKMLNRRYRAIQADVLEEAVTSQGIRRGTVVEFKSNKYGSFIDGRLWGKVEKINEKSIKVRADKRFGGHLWTLRGSDIKVYKAKKGDDKARGRMAV